MENKELYFVITGIVILSLFGYAQINKQNRIIEDLEKNITGYESEIDNMQKTISEFEITVDILEKSLEKSENNSTELKNNLRLFMQSTQFLEFDNEVLEEAIQIIGRDDVNTLLIYISEKTEEIQTLQHAYDTLLKEYNNLLENN